MQLRILYRVRNINTVDSQFVIVLSAYSVTVYCKVIKTHPLKHLNLHNPVFVKKNTCPDKKTAFFFFFGV